MAELHEWLGGSEAIPQDPASPVVEDCPIQNLSSPIIEFRVEFHAGASRMLRRPHYVVGQEQCEENFRALPIPSIEPFPVEVAEWDMDDPSSRLLLQVAEWPTEKVLKGASTLGE